MSQGLCPSCGAAVNLTAGQDEINCTYCGTLVKRPEAEAQFAEVKNSKFGGTLLIAQTAQEGGSYSEALSYYNKVIEQEPTFADAWLNKGICMVRSSKIGDIKIPEAISSWRAAIKFAKHPDAMKKRVALEINNVVSDFYPVLEEHYRKFSKTDDAYEEHARRFNLLDSALALALELDPKSETIARNGIALCTRFLESVSWGSGYVSGLADRLAAPIQRSKSKYERVLAGGTFSPSSPADFQARLQSLGITAEVAELIYKGDERAAQLEFSKSYRRDLTKEQFTKGGHFEKIVDAVNSAEAVLKTEYPERFSAAPQKSGCFVATACYDDYDHPTVVELRRFRDEYLEASRAGRAFVRWYYNWSPAFARLVTSSSALTVLAKVVIVLPATLVARFVKWKSRRVSG